MEPKPKDSDATSADPEAASPVRVSSRSRHREYFLGGAAAVTLLVGGFFVFRGATVGLQRSQCLANVRQLTTAALMYVEDNQTRLPSGARWMDRIEAHLSGPGTERCPAVGNDASGYSFSRAMGNQEVARLANPAALPLLFDGLDTSRNAVGSIESDLAVGRHGSPNVGYADGSARTVARGPKAITN